MELDAAEACDILVTCCRRRQGVLRARARGVRHSILVPNGIDVRRFRGIEAHRAETRRALGMRRRRDGVPVRRQQVGPQCRGIRRPARLRRANAELLTREGIHILVVGSVAAEPVRIPGLTATGRVDVVEPYFAAADAALNPDSQRRRDELEDVRVHREPFADRHHGLRGPRIPDRGWQNGLRVRRGGPGAAHSRRCDVSSSRTRCACEGWPTRPIRGERRRHRHGRIRQAAGAGDSRPCPPPGCTGTVRLVNVTTVPSGIRGPSVDGHHESRNTS